MFGGALLIWALGNLRRGDFSEAAILGAYAASIAYALLFLIIYRRIHIRWGFSIQGMGGGCLAALPMVLMSLAPAVLVGCLRGAGLSIPTFPLHPGHYLIWCLIQDFIFFSFCARSLAAMVPSAFLASLGVGILFGISHLPFHDLASLTVPVGLLWSWIFLKTGSLYPIVVAHWSLGLAVLRPPA